MASEGRVLVANWLVQLGLEEWQSRFVEMGYDDMEVCAEMTEEDLDSMGISLLDVRRILLNAAKNLREKFRKRLNTTTAVAHPGYVDGMSDSDEDDSIPSTPLSAKSMTDVLYDNVQFQQDNGRIPPLPPKTYPVSMMSVSYPDSGTGSDISLNDVVSARSSLLSSSVDSTNPLQVETSTSPQPIAQPHQPPKAPPRLKKAHSLLIPTRPAPPLVSEQRVGSAVVPPGSESVAAVPPAVQEEDENLSGPTVIEEPKEIFGFLTKQGGSNNNKGWKRRWCTYSNGNLRYFRSSSDPEPAGLVSQYIMTSVQRSRNIDPRYGWSFEVSTNRHRVYMFAASSEVEMNDWMATLQQAINFARSQSANFVIGGSMNNPDKEGTMAFGGILLVTDKKGRLIGSWPQRYVVIKDDLVCYYRSREDYEVSSPLTIIDSVMASAKCDKNRVIIDTNKWRYVFKTDSVAEAENWTRAVQNSIQFAFNKLNSKEDRAVSVMQPSNAAALSSNTFTTTSTTERLNSRAGIQSFMSTDDGNMRNSVDVNPEAETKFMMGEEAFEAIRVNKANRYCADCNAADPDWASINLGIPLCIECSGIHRALGVHISKVRSIKLDKWTPTLVRLMVSIGTANSNEFWEGNCGEGYTKPMSETRRNIREDYIRAKYERQAYCLRDKLADPDVTGAQLVRAAATDNLMEVVELLAMGADVNYMDRDLQYKTALHLAATNGKPLQVQLLLLNGAQPTVTDEAGCPPLHYADANGHTEVCELLEKTISKQSGAIYEPSGEANKSVTQQRRGFLWKQGGANNNKGWRRRWMVFEGTSLRYYRTETDREAAGSLNIRDITGVSEAEEENTKDPRFKYCFEVVTCSPRDYLLCAESEEDQRAWMEAIKSVIPVDGIQPKKGSNLLDLLETADKAGSLYKRGGSFTAWKRRYFILRGKELYYFRSKEDMEVLGVISMKKVTAISEGEETVKSVNAAPALPEHILHIVTPTRTFFLKADSEDDLQSWIVALRNTQVFGISLELATHGQGNIPSLVLKSLAFLEKCGLDKEGLYRVPGNTAKINHLKMRVNQDESQVFFDNECMDRVHDVAGLLKLFFRSLPDPLLTWKLYPHFISACRLPDHESRLVALQNTVNSLPPVNYDTLKRVIDHLTQVAQMGAVNKMTEQNLAIVFGPTLMTVNSGEPTALGDMSEQYRVVEHLISYYHWMFGVDENALDSKEVAAITEGMDADTAARVAEAMRKMEMAQKQHRSSLAQNPQEAANTQPVRSQIKMEVVVMLPSPKNVMVEVDSSTSASQFREAALEDVELADADNWNIFESNNGGEYERALADLDNVFAVTSKWTVGTGLNCFLLKVDASYPTLRALQDRNDPKICKKGFLHKEGGSIRNWRKRYFVAMNGKMTYYKSQDSSSELGNFPLRNMQVYVVGPGKKNPTPHAIMLRFEDSTRFLAADTAEDMNEWIGTLRYLIEVESAPTS